LWGGTSVQTQKRLNELHGGRIRSACIGPAGEGMILYSTIVSGRRTASRGGVGAVMGSKNLKAVVINAKKKKLGYDQAAFDQLARQQVEEYHAEGGPSVMTDYFSQYGTGFNTTGQHQRVFPCAQFPIRSHGWLEKLTNVQFGALTHKHVGLL